MAAARSAAGGAGMTWAHLEELQRLGDDADALDEIAEVLRSRVWCAALVPIIAEVVRATGRAVDGVEE